MAGLGPSAVLLVFLLLCPADTSAQAPSANNEMYVRILESMVRRMGMQLPLKPGDAQQPVSVQAAQCGPPPHVPHASTTLTASGSGDITKHVCDIGYGFGEATRVCQADGQWSNVTLVCAPLDCGPPPSLSGASVAFGGTTVGSAATYRCQQGYQSNGQDGGVECTPDSKWSKTALTCTLIASPAASNNASSADMMMSLLKQWQNLPPEMRSMPGSPRRYLQDTYPPAVTSPTWTPAPTIRAAPSPPSPDAMQPLMQAMINQMQASLGPVMKAMIANALPQTPSPATPAAPPQPAMPSSTPGVPPPNPVNAGSNSPNLIAQMQQMQMMQMMMGSRRGGNQAFDPEAMAEAAADSMTKGYGMMGMPGMMGMGGMPMGMGANPMMAGGNTLTVNPTNDPFLFPVRAPGPFGNNPYGAMYGGGMFLGA